MMKKRKYKISSVILTLYLTIDNIVQYSDLNNPQVKEIIAKLQGEIEVMEGIILYCTTGEKFLI